MGKFPVEAANVGLRPRKRVIAPFQIYFHLNDHKSREFGLLKVSDIYSKNIVQLCYTMLYYIYIYRVIVILLFRITGVFIFLMKV